MRLWKLDALDFSNSALSYFSTPLSPRGRWAILHTLWRQGADNIRLTSLSPSGSATGLRPRLSGPGTRANRFRPIIHLPGAIRKPSQRNYANSTYWICRICVVPLAWLSNGAGQMDDWAESVRPGSRPGKSGPQPSGAATWAQ